MTSNPSNFQCEKCMLYFRSKHGLELHKMKLYPCKDKQDIGIKKDTIINTGKTLEKMVSKIKTLDIPENEHILVKEAEEVEQDPVVVERNNFQNLNDRITKLSNILEIETINILASKIHLNFLPNFLNFFCVEANVVVTVESVNIIIYYYLTFLFFLGLV